MRSMFDSVAVVAIPEGSDLVAGYDDGHWPDADALALRFPGKRVVRVTTNPAHNEGDVLDVEKGDATPAELPGWLSRRRALGAWPSAYCDLSTWPACQEAVARAGLEPPPWWVAAAPGNGANLYPGTVAHQYATRSSPAGSYDVSVVADYWPGVDPAPLTLEELMGASVAIAPDGTAHIAAVGKDGGRTDHLLHATVPPGGGSVSIIDLTDLAVPLSPPGTPPYTVAP